jgi:hypothetical protein
MRFMLYFLEILGITRLSDKRGEKCKLRNQSSYLNVSNPTEKNTKLSNIWLLPLFVFRREDIKTKMKHVSSTVLSCEECVKFYPKPLQKVLTTLVWICDATLHRNQK